LTQSEGAEFLPPNVIVLPSTPRLRAIQTYLRDAQSSKDDYSFYSHKSLFTHPDISEETIGKYMSLAYRKSIFLNPHFIVRRLWRGIRTGDIFTDIYYVFKFIFLPATAPKGASNYYAQDRWPVYDYSGKKLSRTDYQVVRKPAPNTIRVVNR